MVTLSTLRTNQASVFVDVPVRVAFTDPLESIGTINENALDLPADCLSTLIQIITHRTNYQISDQLLQYDDHSYSRSARKCEPKPFVTCSLGHD
jgi:hypothetical protein